jgi:hypothetical protein
MVDGRPGPGMAVPHGAAAMGRTQREASDVDGVVFLKGRTVARLAPGSIRTARITHSLDYDLVASLD